MAFVSFISYSHVNKTRYVEKFVRELSQQVLDKTQFAPGDIAFFDTSSIDTGQDWARVLGDALRTCKVIVCICTPRYLSSPFCGKELQVFLLRRQAWLQRPENAARKAGIVFPVLWELPPGGLPKALAQFQFADGAFPKKYTDNGLNALAQVSRERDNFRTVIIRLAERIRDAVTESDLPEWPLLPPFDDIPSMFHTDTTALSYQSGIAFLHDRGRGWCPFGGPPAWSLLDLVAAHTNRLCRDVPADAGMLAQLLQSETRREAVAILTDTDTLDDPARVALLQELDEKLPVNCAIVALPGAAGFDPLAVERARARFPRISASAGPHSWCGVRSQTALVTELVRTMEVLAAGILRSDPAGKFEDPQARAEAQAAGRELEVAPSVSGPGGAR